VIIAYQMFAIVSTFQCSLVMLSVRTVKTVKILLIIKTFSD